MNTVYAWLSIESSEQTQYVRHLETLLEESSDPRGTQNLENELERISKNDAPQTLLAAESIGNLIGEANARLVVLGVHNPEALFDVEDLAGYPGERELGGGLVARLFACDARGVNFSEAQEPRTE